MRALVTGGGGYIGSVLVRRLLRAGYDVRVLDRFFFGRGPLASVSANPRLRLIRGDTRWFDPRILRNTDVVMDLAAISNDPSGELDPRKTMEINYRGRARVARLCRERGVGRYILASSCSIYGSADGVLDEQSAVNPLTTYARANRRAEAYVERLAGERFTVAMLRFATVFGLSPRMRFDLAVNGMVLGLHRGGQIPVMRDGSQWRSFIHVRDAADAYVAAARAPAERINGQIINIGSERLNYQILPLARHVAAAMGVRFRKRWYGDPDTRSYRIGFRKARDLLGFEARRDVAHGAREVHAALKAGRTTDSAQTMTVGWYRHIIEANRISGSLSIDGRML